MQKKQRILECTLRDGSYVIGFQFTEEQTRLIVKALETTGFDMIEVGHGMGLGASEKGKGKAAETDEVYLKATAETIKNADWGMFCIPGIAELHHIDMAAEYGMKFIRIGTNTTSYQESQKFVERAKKHDMFVCSNFMKSYVVPPTEFAKYALEAQKYGADLVYIVDSAGGMFPEDIEKYVMAIREKSDNLALGFHGHNNLGLAVVNALKAFDLGIEIVDTSLQGFGRSSGNTPTEQLICTLMRKGVDLGIDPILVMDVAEQFIRPLIEAKGLSSLDTVAGLALFHSSYMPIIKRYATEYRVDPRRLIIAVCQKNQTDAPDDLVKQQAKYLAEVGIKGNWKPLYANYYGGEQETMLDGLSFLQNQLAQSIDYSATALVSEGKEISYKELVDKSRGLAAFWKNQGIRPGDKIAVKLPNSLEFIYCYVACILGGYTIVPMNSDLSQRNLDYILQLVKPQLLVNNFEQIQYSSTNSNDFNSTNDSILAIFFTSGTTSVPKAVCHYLGNMLANAIGFNQLVGIDRNTRMMHIMPMGYMAGFLNTILCPLIAGGTIVVAPQFNAKEAMNFWKPAIESNVDALWLTPTMAALLARLNRTSTTPKWTKNNLRHVFVGTAPLPKVTKEKFESTFGIPTLESYGMTEILIVASNHSASLQKQGSVGHLLEGIEVEARDKEGNPLPQGEIGELFIKTPFALKGYLPQEAGQITSPLKNGWFATGDCGYLDPDDDLFITGRIKDLIIHGGTNISPPAVEHLLMEHPDVQEAVVLGKTHPFWGEEVVAFLIMKVGKSFHKESIDEYCKSNLEFDAVPTTYKVVNDFPRSSTGKVKKHSLKEVL